MLLFCGAPGKRWTGAWMLHLRGVKTYSKLAPGIEMACTAIGQEHGVLLDRRWGVCPRRARDGWAGPPGAIGGCRTLDPSSVHYKY